MCLKFFRSIHRKIIKVRKVLFDIPPVTAEEEYAEAFKFKSEFTPKKEADYDWVEEYAKFNFGEMKKSCFSLDTKAESLIRVFAGGSGLLSLGAVLKLSDVSIYVAACWFIALLFAVLTLVTAGFVRYPRGTSYPAPIDTAADFATVYEEKEAKYKFIGLWHVASVGFRLTSERKAEGLKYAFSFGLLSIVALALSFPVAMLTMEVNTSKPKHGEAVMPQPENDSQPSAQSQDTTSSAQPSPAEAAQPQIVQNDNNPAAIASPQWLTESDRSKR